MTVFFFLLGLILVLPTVPLLFELFVLTVASWLPCKAGNGLQAEDFALCVIVPAHNEELLIGNAVRSLLAASGPDDRVVVIAHNCTDHTATRALEAGAYSLDLNNPELLGKGYALSFGFEQALAMGADAVLVIDADSTVTPNLLKRVRSGFASGMEVLQCRYDMEAVPGRPQSQITALALRGFNLVRPLGRQNLSLSAGILGNGFAISANVLRQIPYGALSIVEDLEYHIHLVTAGKRVHFLRDARVISSLPGSDAGDAAQRSRWEGGRLHAARQWCLPLTQGILRGHFRLMEPLLELTALPMAYGVLLLLTAAVVPSGAPRVLALAGLGIIAMHVITAVVLSPDRMATLGALVRVPFYILRKLVMIPRMLRNSSSNAAWVRTARDGQTN